MAAVDVEDESILTAIFQDSFPESWRENTDFIQYLAELSSYGVEKLGREPDRLAEERSQILEQTQDLAFHNYKTFIQTAECSRDIFQDFQIIERHVVNMLEKLPQLVSQCEQFSTKAQEINSSRRMNNSTLQRHTQLLEILEVPQLMDTCVRNAYYEEALELAGYVRRLEKKHDNIAVISNIVSEVKNSMQLMLNQLLQQLRTNIQLPACLRVIGYLRRMNVFTETELRLKFLQARDSWFQNILDGIPKDDAYYHINKTIEASRVHLFDVITQYRAIFSDDDPLIMTSKDDTLGDAAMFHGWVIMKVSQFLQTLESDLERGVGGRLDSLLGQCMYFGLSFSRVGADFRGLLAPIFQKTARNSFLHSLNEANTRFDESMQSYTLLGTSSSLPSSAYGLSSQVNQTLQPPIMLLEFLPLAQYCNNILTAFNDLRLCAPIALAGDVSVAVQHSLTRAGEAIAAYHRAEETTFNKQEKERFTIFVQAFAEELVTFLNRCLQEMFPVAQISQVLGMPVGELSKMEGMGTMNIGDIRKPLVELLPEEPPIPEPVKTVNVPVEVEETREQDKSSLDVTESPDSSELAGGVSDVTDLDGKTEIKTEENSDSEVKPIVDTAVGEGADSGPTDQNNTETESINTNTDTASDSLNPLTT